MVVIDEPVSREWQSQVSTWLVKSGCLCMMAWGNDCSTWDDSVDHANLLEFDFGEIPEGKIVFTTWHENAPLKEVFWYSKNSAFHSTVSIENTLILHISITNREKEILLEYGDA